MGFALRRRVHAPFSQALCGFLKQPSCCLKKEFLEAPSLLLPLPPPPRLFSVFTPARSFSSSTASALRGAQVPRSRLLPPGPANAASFGRAPESSPGAAATRTVSRWALRPLPAPGTPRPPARPRARAGGACGGRGAGRGAGARLGVAASSAACWSLETRTCLRLFLQRLHPSSRASSSRRPRRRAPGGCLGGPGRGPAASAARSARPGPGGVHAPAARRAHQQHALFPDGDHGRDGDAGVLLRVHRHVHRERAGLLLPRQRLPQALPGPGGQQRRAPRAPLLAGRRGPRARGKSGVSALASDSPRSALTFRVEAPRRVGRGSFAF